MDFPIEESTVVCSASKQVRILREGWGECERCPRSRPARSAGVLITMEAATNRMLKEAPDAGFYKSPHLEEKFPRIQILTGEQLLGGEQMKYPRWVDATFKKAPKARGGSRRNVQLNSNAEQHIKTSQGEPNSE